MEKEVTVQTYMHLNNWRKVALVTVANKTMTVYFFEHTKKWNNSNVLKSTKRFRRSRYNINKTVIKTTK